MVKIRIDNIVYEVKSTCNFEDNEIKEMVNEAVNFIKSQQGRYLNLYKDDALFLVLKQVFGLVLVEQRKHDEIIEFS